MNLRWASTLRLAKYSTALSGDTGTRAEACVAMWPGCDRVGSLANTKKESE